MSAIPRSISVLMEQVKSYFSNRAFRSDHKNQSVELRDINTLVGASWLNDEVINMYLAMVQSRNEEAAAAKTHGSYKDVYPMSTFFYQKLAEQGYEKAKLARWTKRAKVRPDLVSKTSLTIGRHFCQRYRPYPDQRRRYALDRRCAQYGEETDRVLRFDGR